MAKRRSRSRSRSPTRRTKAECALVKSRKWRKSHKVTKGSAKGSRRRGSCTKRSRRSRSRKSH